MNYSPALIQLPLVKESAGNKITTPEDIYATCGDLADLAQESFHVLTMDAKNHLISRNMITLGLVSASLVHPREVFRQSIIDGASGIVLIHNHPTGDPTPSAEDIRVTQQLCKAGKILDINILDHVIIGRGKTPFCSLRESGIVNF